MGKKKAIIIGAGPAGLTAAYEFLKRTDIIPIIIEKDKQVGGISKTVDYKGNKMDFGPHRFFSKSDRVMNWWTNIMPLHTPKGEELTISYQNKSRKLDTGEFLTTDDNNGLPPENSMLVIPRLTRIYFLRQFFEYPIKLSIATLGQLGIWTTIKIVCSYLYARIFPRKPQNSLEDFMINKFGSVLYHIFFKDYTEKVWGMDCNKISADWGAQRIKGVSLSKAVIHAAKALTKRKKGDINQKNTETSLIEQFLYPAKGAGAMWEEVARQVVEMGGKIVTNYDIKHLQTDGDQITSVEALNTQTGQMETLEGDYFISTMPVQELIAGLKANVPPAVKEVAAGLIYRDFVYAGVLVKKMTMETPKDSWIYIQERDVTVARMQIYNNWGPYVVADPNTVWLGLEYFCTKGDAIWNLSDQEIERKAVEELIKMNLVIAEDVLDTKVNRMEKTYPAYFGTYDRFNEIQKYLDNFDNLFLVGRNGMHKYNNADHSMLTAMVAVDNIIIGRKNKDNIWDINTEQEYHEVKKEGADKEAPQKVPQPSKEMSFKAFVFQYPGNQTWLRGGIITSVVLFIVFKILYPFADYSNDSWTYIANAWNNDNVSIRPIGYSKFIRAISAITTSDFILTAIQYFSVQAALLYLFFTVKYWFGPRKGISIIAFILLLSNPVNLYIGNYISSDAMFAALSLIWFTHLIWIIQRPRILDWLFTGSLFFIILAFRYNALYYPFVLALAYLLSKQVFWKKAIGIGFTCFILILFIGIVKNENYQKSGVKNFSSFSGWQMAANALYAYPHITLNSSSLPTTEMQKMDKFIKHYFDTLKNKELPPLTSTMLLWGDSMPLKRYWYQYMKERKVNNGADSMRAFNELEPVYGQYAQYIVKHFPRSFSRYYLLPNLKEYIKPSLEVFTVYNLGLPVVKPIAKDWFRYDSIAVKAPLQHSQKRLLAPFTYFFTSINILFSFALGVLLIKKYKSLYLNWLFVSFLITNAAFSILAAPVVFRYQFVPMLLAVLGFLMIVDQVNNRKYLSA